jgi:spore germination protein
MAVAPLNRVREVLEFGVTQMPPGKIFMGIPNYGYDWPLPFVRGETKARTIGVVEAVDIARRYGAEIQFDSVAQSPFFTYTDENGTAHEVWFEDARSIQRKLALIPELGLRGASYWTIMRPFPQNWAVLNALYNIRQ